MASLLIEMGEKLRTVLRNERMMQLHAGLAALSHDDEDDCRRPSQDSQDR